MHPGERSVHVTMKGGGGRRGSGAPDWQTRLRSTSVKLQTTSVHVAALWLEHAARRLAYVSLALCARVPSPLGPTRLGPSVGVAAGPCWAMSSACALGYVQRTRPGLCPAHEPWAMSSA